MRVCVSMSICVHVYMRVCVSVFMCLHVSVCLALYMYFYVRVYGNSFWLPYRGEASSQIHPSSVVFRLVSFHLALSSIPPCLDALGPVHGRCGKLSVSACHLPAHFEEGGDHSGSAMGMHHGGARVPRDPTPLSSSWTPIGLDGGRDDIVVCREGFSFSGELNGIKNHGCNSCSSLALLQNSSDNTPQRLDVMFPREARLLYFD